MPAETCSRSMLRILHKEVVERTVVSQVTGQLHSAALADLTTGNTMQVV